MENKDKSPEKIKLLFAAILIIVIPVSLLSGYYYGAWLTGKQYEEIPISEIIESAPDFFTTNNINVNLFWTIWQNVKSKYVNQPVDESKLFYGALQGMVGSIGDPYSIYLDPSATESFNKELSGSFEGIGAEIGIKNNQVTIIAPLHDSPAANAGLKAGDKIIQIDGTETIEMSIEEAVSLIRGKKGSVVILKINSGEDQALRDVAITRDVITVNTVNWEMINNNIALINIIHFNTDSYQEFSKAVTEILVKNPDGIILDLRNNPGGFLKSSVDIAGEFIENDVVVIENLVDSKVEYKSEGIARLKNFKVAVLVNVGSASASEILAGALQDYGIGHIIGEQSYGKGTVQDYEQFDDGSSLKLTVANWLTPKGRMINNLGITPDIEVLMTIEDYNNDNDTQLNAAIEYLIE